MKYWLPSVTKMAKKIYSGEIGELYKVKFLPEYMQAWSEKKILLFNKVFEKLPKKLAKLLEEFLIQEYESDLS